jgi:hypothetical protein
VLGILKTQREQKSCRKSNKMFQKLSNIEPTNEIAS